jgi:hypothetical protein
MVGLTPRAVDAGHQAGVRTQVLGVRIRPHQSRLESKERSSS